MDRPRITTRRLWIAAAAGIGFVFAIWLLGARGGSEAGYRTQPAESGRIVASVSATGTVTPVVQVEVGSQVSGTIASLHADYNDRVERGRVLAQLEPSLFRTAVVQAEANVARAEAAFREAERALRRARELHEREVVSEVDLELAESVYEQRGAELRQARASLETARVNLGHTTIRSPISGVVISRQVDVGQTVAASLQAPVLFTLAQDLERMRIESKIDEADIGRIAPDLPVAFTVDAYPDDRFRGRVSQVRLEPVTEDNVVTYTTVIEVGNEEGLLRPGMTANVTIVVARRDSALKVPNAALRFRPPGESGGGTARASVRGARDAAGGGPAEREGGSRRGDGAPPRRIFVLDAGGRPTPVEVRTGITDGAYTEITGGELAPGDPVVIGVKSGEGGDDLAPPPGFGGRRRR